MARDSSHSTVRGLQTSAMKVGILAIIVAVVLIGFDPIVSISPPEAATIDAAIPDRVLVGCRCPWKLPAAGALFLVGGGIVLVAVVSERRVARRRTGG